MFHLHRGGGFITKHKVGGLVAGGFYHCQLYHSIHAATELNDLSKIKYSGTKKGP